MKCPDSIKIRIEDPQSEFYRGPKTESNHVIYAECKGKAILVEFDSEDNFTDALVKTGVHLYQLLNEDYKKPALILPPDHPVTPENPDGGGVA